MFGNKTCKVCAEKEKQITFLKEQNKDLYDRLMAFNQQAFTVYNAEKKPVEQLYPIGIDEKGKVFSYKDTNLEKQQEEMFKAFGEEPITVEDKPEEVASGS